MDISTTIHLHLSEQLLIITIIIVIVIIFIIILIRQCLDLLEGLIPCKEEQYEPRVVVSATHLSRLFVFALMWGVGALLELDDRAKMEEFLVKHGKLPLPDIEEGSHETIFEFVVDDSGKCELVGTIFSFLRLGYVIRGLFSRYGFC